MITARKGSEFYRKGEVCMIKKTVSLFAAAVIFCTAALPFGANARTECVKTVSEGNLSARAQEDITVINGNELAPFKDRTKEQIASLWKDAEIAEYDSIFIDGGQSSYVSPYSGGTLKQEVLDNVQRNLNYYRYLVGSPAITEPMVNNPDLQNASVLQAINLRDGVNGVGLTHSLWEYKKPDDMDETFYNSAVYANHNIISSYNYRAAVRGFFGESHFTYTAGHRTSLLSPYVGSVQMGLGGATYGLTRETAEAGQIFEQEFAAYPAPGLFPKQDLASQSDWDIYLNEKHLKTVDEGKVSAKITDLVTGECFEYSKELGNLSAGRTIFLAAPRKDGGTYYSHSYKVEVKGLYDTSDRPAEIEYTVDFYDKFEGTESAVQSVSFGDIRKTIAFVDGESAEDAIKKISLFMPKTIEVTLESGSRFSIAVTGWSYERKSYTYFPGVTGEIVRLPSFDSKDIPKYVSDPESIRCEYTVFLCGEGKMNFSSKGEKTDGVSGGTAELDLTVDYDNVKYSWYKISADQTVSPVLSDERIALNGPKLVIGNLNPQDSGRYFAVANSDSFGNFYYVSDLFDLSVDGTPCMCGDLDGNGRITAVDALITLCGSVGEISLTEGQSKAADVDFDGTVTANDALKILCYSVGKINSF